MTCRQLASWRRWKQTFCWIPLFFCSLALPVMAGTSIVPIQQQITDNAARITLAELLTAHDDAASLTEAEALLRMVATDDPENYAARAAQISVLLRQGQADESLKLAQRLHREAPDAIPWTLLLADVQAAVGHYTECRDLYRVALRQTPDDHDMLVRFADKSNLWGDFNRAEHLFRSLLRSQPQNMRLRLRLARVLLSQQRYQETTGLLQEVLRQPGIDQDIWSEATLLLADAQRMEKDFPAALHTVRQALQSKPIFNEAALSEGELLLLNGQTLEAEAVFRDVSTSSADKEIRYRALVGQGRSLIRQNDTKDAVVVLDNALTLQPRAYAAQLYLLLAQTPKGEPIATDRFGKPTAVTLSAWGDILAGEGSNQAALTCYRQALQSDPRHFPSRLGLAQTLASTNQYAEALSELQILRDAFPESDTVLLAMARVQAWDKQYPTSLKNYDLLIKSNPANPVPNKEAARTAYWAKMPKQGDDYYQRLYAQPVDQLLAQQIKPLQAQGLGPLPQPSRIKTAPDWDPPPYLSYEALQQRLSSLRGNLRLQVETILHRLEPDYRLQKSIYLEHQAKRQAYNRHFIHATDSLDELLIMQPGNEEALFDLAQAQCTQGLYGCERTTLQRLLQIDPAHSLAGYALQRSERRTHPALSFGYSLWEEDGYGELAQMSRGHAATSLDLPFADQYALIVGSHHFWDHPKLGGPTREAYGQSIGLNGVLTPASAFSADVLQKWYDGGPDGTTTGMLNFSFNLEDYVRLNLGYRRSEEYANTFALENDLQADRLKASLDFFPVRPLELGLGYEQIFYTDDNDQSLVQGHAKVTLTDHPRTLSVSANAEHRHASEQNQYVYQGDTLLNIIHPYWTPQHYSAASLTLEWRHDLSEFFFCGSQLHYYDIKLTGGDDSDDNPFIRTSLAWHWEFKEHWTWDIEGMLHQSDQWKANALITGLSYRF